MDIKKALINHKSILTIVILAAMFLINILSGGNDYYMSVIVFILIYIIVCNGLDILYGYCGQISMGHAAFYAIGCYGSQLLHQYFNLPIPLCMIIISFFSAAVGALLAYPASKLVFHFLSLSTIAFGEIVYNIALHSPGAITGDAQGLFGDQMTFFGEKITTYSNYFYIVLLCTIILLVLKNFLVSGKTGRAFMAIRENTKAAAGMGVNVRAYKVIAFATSAFYTAFAGALYMHIACWCYPNMFQQKQSVLFVTMLLFGGSGTYVGPIVGPIIVMVITEALRFLEQYQVFVYGCLLLIVIIALPGGVYKAALDLVSSIRNKIMKKKKLEKRGDQVA